MMDMWTKPNTSSSVSNAEKRPPRAFRRCQLFTAAALLMLCGSTAFAMASPAPMVVRDLVYSTPDNRPLKLDLYLPVDAAEKKRPVVVWIHGGGWHSGSKRNGGRLLPMVGKGFVVADINYRLSGTAPFPAQIIDCKAAVRWLRAHAEEYGIDPDRIGIAGESAGAHLAALVGTSAGTGAFEQGDHLDQSSAVQAVCALSPATDMKALETVATEKDRDVLRKLLGGDPRREPYRSLLEQTNPIRFINGGEPPFFILHGTHDQRIPYTQSVLLYEALKKAGDDAEVFYVKEGDHMLNHGTNASPRRINAMIAEFFEKKLR